MKTFLFIHGAWASKNSFNFISSQLTKVRNIYHEYDTNNTELPAVIEEIKAKLDTLENVTVVGHSLGGVIALSLEAHPNVDEIITIASPISGIKINKIAQSFLTFRAPILKSVMSDSAFMFDLKNHKFTKPVTIFVANKGFNPAVYEKSDGVITYASQTDWVPETGTIVNIEASHHEILQSWTVTDFINYST
jgi:pimeloyl-ACP methyl ester carboxylesterase